MDIGPLIQAMNEIAARAEAQLPHADRLTASLPVWDRVLTGMQDVEQLLRTGAAEVSPSWPDAAGELYADRLRRSATTVQGWQQTLAGAAVGPTVGTLAELIRAKVDAIRAARDEFTAVLGELGQVATVAAVVARLRAIAERAAGLLRELDEAFVDAARRLEGTVDGTPWDGPAATMALSSDASPGSSDASSGAGGGLSGGGGPVATSLDGVMPGGAAELAGSTVPAPIGPATGSLPPVPAPSLPTVPSPAGLPVVGAGPLGTSRSRQSAGSIGSISPVGLGGSVGSGGSGGGSSIAKVSRNVVAAGPLAGAEPPEPPAASGNGTSTAVSGGGVARGVPPMMALGAGARPAAGAAEVRAGGHRGRPLSAVPGVPPGLRGRSGPLTRAPGYLAEPAPEPAPATADPEPLDDELWQVAQAPRPTRGRKQA